MAKELDCVHKGSEFKLQSRSYFRFQTNSLEGDMDEIVYLRFFYKDCYGIK